MRWIAVLLTTSLLASSALAANATNYTGSAFQEQQNHFARSQLEEMRKHTELLTNLLTKQDAQIQALQVVQQQQTQQMTVMQQQLRLQQQLIQILQTRTQQRPATGAATR